MFNENIVWYSVADAAHILNVSERTVQRRIADGKYAIRMSGKRKEVALPRELQIDKLKSDVQALEREIKDIKEKLDERSD